MSYTTLPNGLMMSTDDEFLRDEFINYEAELDIAAENEVIRLQIEAHNWKIDRERLVLGLEYSQTRARHSRINHMEAENRE